MLNPDFSFHARFTESRLVSHFTPIPLKRETRDHFRASLPMKRLAKDLKRSPRFLTSFVSCLFHLVSARFTFRFTPISAFWGRPPYSDHRHPHPGSSRGSGTPRENFWKAFKQTQAASGLTEWPHNALRHSFASYHLVHLRERGLRQ
jgi:hypothetical protein